MFENDDHQHGGKQQTEKSKSKNKNKNVEQGTKKELRKCKEIQSKIRQGRDAEGRIGRRGQNRAMKIAEIVIFL